MPIPTRLANDGWWLCEPAATFSMAASSHAIEKGRPTMTVSFATEKAETPAEHALWRPLAIALCATAAADCLFYGHVIGVSFAIFVVLLIACTAIANPHRAHMVARLRASAVAAVALAPAITSVNLASLACGVIGAILAVLMITAPLRTKLRDRLWAARDLLIEGPFRLLPDLARSGRGTLTANMFVAWIVPLVLGIVFLALFASANPMIEHWVKAIDLRGGTTQFNLRRALFWFVVLSFVWPFVNLRFSARHLAAEPQQEQLTTADDAVDAAPAQPSQLFGATAVFRSLVLFNLLFAVQTMLDVVYLWAGVTLPDGMTYAAYAHRGAYPLIVTALLAAGFILHASNVEQTPQRKRLVDLLIIVWTVQNLLLVLSSILRLDRYVEAYSLTYWRVAAFIWMGLVALGLFFILLRLVLRRSNGWLIRVNLVALVSVLYLCTFVNFAAVVADYNVGDCREIGGKGPFLDADYLVGLGPQAIPALDRYIAIGPDHPTPLKMHRDNLAYQHRTALNSWQAWTIRRWRLQRYLARTTVIKPDQQKSNRLDEPATSIQ